MTQKHGLCGTPTYNSWRSMMRRCYEPSNNRFHLYGGKGISVHPSWHDLGNFARDMGLRPERTSLGRIKDQGNYEPGNVAWQTIAEQRETCKCAAKLNAEQVEVIKSLHQRYSKRGCSTSNMARDLGMSIGAINRVVNGKTRCYSS